MPTPDYYTNPEESEILKKKKIMDRNDHYNARDSMYKVNWAIGNVITNTIKLYTDITMTVVLIILNS